MKKLRECVWAGEPAWFHRWVDKSEIIAPSPMVGGHNGGELRYTVGIIELKNGAVKEVMPSDIIFCTRPTDRMVV